MTDKINILDLVDRDKGGYAIECEVAKFRNPEDAGLIYQTEQFEKIIKKMAKKYGIKEDEYTRRTNSESQNIQEYVIKTDNIFFKSDVYRAFGSITKNYTHFPVGSNGHISGGNHLHIFWKPEGYKLIRKHFKNIYIALLYTGVFTKGYGHKRISRYIDGSVAQYIYFINNKASLSINAKNHMLTLQDSFNSLEIRGNEYIHPAMFLLYLSLISEIVNKKNWLLDENHIPNASIVGHQGLYNCRYKSIDSLAISSYGIKSKINMIIKNIPKRIIQDTYWQKQLKHYMKITGIDNCKLPF